MGIVILIAMGLWLAYEIYVLIKTIILKNKLKKMKQNVVDTITNVDDNNNIVVEMLDDNEQSNSKN